VVDQVLDRAIEPFSAVLPQSIEHPAKKFASASRERCPTWAA
jgi:hypothetical protein